MHSIAVLSCMNFVLMPNLRTHLAKILSHYDNAKQIGYAFACTKVVECVSHAEIEETMCVCVFFKCA